MRITLVVGAAGAQFAHDLAGQLGADDQLTVVAPTVRDRWATGLKVCPDLDALLNPPTAATHEVADELAAIGYAPSWHRPTDRDIANQLVRTELLGAGYSLTDATSAMSVRRELPYALLPMSDDRAELHVVVADADAPRAIHVAEYLSAPDDHTVQDMVLVAGAWSASPAVVEQLTICDVLVLGPDSRTLVIDPVLRTPGLLGLIEDDLPVLVVEHDDTAPAELIRVAGLPETDPGRAQHVPADAAAVLDAARVAVR